jgi:hypothetical protein
MKDADFACSQRQFGHKNQVSVSYLNTYSAPIIAANQLLRKQKIVLTILTETDSMILPDQEYKVDENFGKYSSSQATNHNTGQIGS